MRPTQDFSKGMRDLGGDLTRAAIVCGILVRDGLAEVFGTAWQFCKNLPNHLVITLPNRLVYDYRRDRQMRPNFAYFLLRPPRQE
jgi:hypothetical protein